MPRSARIVIEGLPHHITHRGNRKEVLFKDDEDRVKYLDLLRYYLNEYDIDLWAYCLMDNHVHFVCVPHSKNGLSDLFRVLQMRYCQYFNMKYEYVGHLWQGRYYSCPMDERHSCIAIRYIENNPVRGGLAEKAGDYIWASAHGRIQNMKDVYLRGTCPLEKSIENWNEYLSLKVSEEEIGTLRKCTSRGIPFADKPVIKMVEAALGIICVPGQAGRPFGT